MIWKLLVINFIFWTALTITAARLRATQDFLSPDSNNELTYLSTKNSIKILYNFIWIVALFVALYLNSASIYALLATLMALSALFSFFRFLGYCSPGKKERTLLYAGTLYGYGYLLLSFFLVPVCQVLLFLVARSTL